MKFEAGIFNIPFDEYKDVDAVNASSLKHFAQSPAAYYRYVNRDADNDTKSMSLGTSVHELVFEPIKFHENHVVWAERRGTNKYKEFEAENDGKKILTTIEYDNCFELYKSIQRHPVAPNILWGAGGKSEQSLFWNEHDIYCKGRIDRLNPDCIVDLKTTKNPTPRAFGRDASQFYYHLSMSHYRSGYKIISGDEVPVYLVAVRSSVPFDVYVYEISGDDLRRADAQRQRYFNLLAECRITGVWPDPSQQIIPLDVSPWAYDEPDLEISVDGELLEFGDEEI